MFDVRFLASLPKLNRLAVLLMIGALTLAACTAPTASPVTPAVTVLPTLVATLPNPTEPPAPTPQPTETQQTGSPTLPPTETAEPTPTEPPVTDVTSLPDPNQFTWVEQFTGLQKPVLLTGAGDGSGRLFITTQVGVVWVAKDGQRLEQPFLDVSAISSGPHNAGGGYTERGLLGLAFDPGFSQNGFFYVHYSDLNGDTVLARYQARSDNPDQADPASAVVLLTQKQPYANHNGGMIAFGPDGMLYMALGDGGAAGDPLGAGQDTQTLLGKILRLDVRNAPPYAIPADNPFAAGGGLPEIWALGLRNPWRFSFDSLTGDLYIADVGQNQYEEVNFLAAGSPGGANFGWDFREGWHPFEGQPPEGLTFVEPLTEYTHAEGCSVSGGVVVRDLNLPEWRGVYLYGDFCSGRVWGLLEAAPGKWITAEVFKTSYNISSFGEDDDGGVYLLDHAGGRIYRLAHK